MELRDGVMTIVEVAPGVDVNRDIIAHMDFVPAIARRRQGDESGAVPGGVGRPQGCPGLLEAR